MKPLKIEFTEEYPKAINIFDDERTFLFIHNGDLHGGTHYENNVFRDEKGDKYKAEAWREYEEVAPQKEIKQDKP